MPRCGEQPDSRRRRAWTGAVVALVGLTGLLGPNAGARGAAPVQVLTGARLQELTTTELDALYRKAGPGARPKGRVHGLPIVAPGTPMGPRMSRAARVVWQGKVFSDDGASAVNRFFGAQVVRGNVYPGKSWLDGRPSLILDYQGTSLVYGRYRDEIRQIAPGLYLGVMFTRTSRGAEFNKYFAFETRP